MKKCLIFISILLSALTAFAQPPGAPPETQSTATVKSKVVLLEFSSENLSAQDKTFLSIQLKQRLQVKGLFTFLHKNEVDAIITEKMAGDISGGEKEIIFNFRNNNGCDSPECLKVIGKMLDVPFLILSEVKIVNEFALTQIQVYCPSKDEVVLKYNREATGGVQEIASSVIPEAADKIAEEVRTFVREKLSDETDKYKNIQAVSASKFSGLHYEPQKQIGMGLRVAKLNLDESFYNTDKNHYILTPSLYLGIGSVMSKRLCITGRYFWEYYKTEIQQSEWIDSDRLNPYTLSFMTHTLNCVVNFAIQPEVLMVFLDGGIGLNMAKAKFSNTSNEVWRPASGEKTKTGIHSEVGFGITRNKLMNIEKGSSILDLSITFSVKEMFLKIDNISTSIDQSTRELSMTGFPAISIYTTFTLSKKLELEYTEEEEKEE